SLEAAKAYAEREGIPYHVTLPAPKTLKIQAYADNFR
ncbi:MAG TPA: ETC complex I subunit, partial [Sphingobium sp.]|nr:ETC complex I subunit [Sphingobium sp.]